MSTAALLYFPSVKTQLRHGEEEHKIEKGRERKSVLALHQQARGNHNTTQHSTIQKKH
jgi:hypothetical protein